jgi:hypothetical protein
MSKMILKDQSVILDLSKLKDASAADSLSFLLSTLMSQDQLQELKVLSLSSLVCPDPTLQNYLKFLSPNLVILNLSSIQNVDIGRQISHL